MLIAFTTFLLHPSQQFTVTFKSTLCTEGRGQQLVSKEIEIEIKREKERAIAHLKAFFFGHIYLFLMLKRKKRPKLKQRKHRRSLRTEHVQRE